MLDDLQEIALGFYTTSLLPCDTLQSYLDVTGIDYYYVLCIIYYVLYLMLWSIAVMITMHDT